MEDFQRIQDSNNCAWFIYLNLFLFVAEENKAIAALANKPVPVENFLKHVEQRRRYPALLKVEFQVREI